MSITQHRSGLLVAASILSLGFASTAHASESADSANETSIGVDLDISNDVAGLDLSTVDTVATFFALHSNNPETHPEFVVDENTIVPRSDLSPNTLPPSGILDPVNITGVGQMVTNNDPNRPGASLGTCTGTLINPRTVIFAAHCVNTRPASAYGAASGGTPISFGFQANNLPGLRRWLGFDGAPAPFQTDTNLAIYNVENVWYDPRSLVGGFLQADYAIATLDTPAFDIPTWAMLFTPLDGQEHVTVTGYGSIGTGENGYFAFGGWRRRVAENYVSFLGSLQQRNLALFGPGSVSSQLPQNLYMSAFNSPRGFDPATRSYDFGLFGENDTLLPREGITGSGDSGGPLILDQKYDIPLILGVLSGGSRFFANQPFGAYGTHSFYQPLHAFWDQIVANNPYVYATNKEGDGEWTDGAHWVQEMDPSYQIVVDGKLVNGLPSTPGEGISGEGATFGDICFLGDCIDFTDPKASTVDGPAYFVEGGPGSTGFVPNNVAANPALGVRPRYYDVTLSARGTTTLRGADVTIDLLTLDGPTKLDVAKDASLRSLGEFNQFAGWTNVDGLMQASEAFFLTGFLTGSGTVKAPWVTTVATIVAPGGADKVGTLTVDGNLVMASASALFIDASRNGADKLSVTGTLSLSDPSDSGSIGPSLVFSKTPGGPAPRHGQSFAIATAGSIEGTFGKVFSFQGVLRPELDYGANEIVATLRAGSLVEILEGQNPTAIAFATALDQLRDGSYDALYNLYGMVDLMNGASLSTMLSGLAPRLGTATHSLQSRQSGKLSMGVSDRLSIMAGGQDGRMSLTGAPEALRMGFSGIAGQRNVRMGLADLTPTGDGQSMTLPEGFSGFVSGGVFGSRDGTAREVVDGGQTGSYFGLGIERELDVGTSFGMAVGYADGREMGGNGLMNVRTTQVAAYGAHDLGNGVYVGGVASMDDVDLDTQRAGFDGLVDQRLFGASEMKRYAVNAELGINLAVSEGLTLTPRTQLGYERTNLAGYTEQGSQVALRMDALSMESVTARTGFKLAGSHATLDGWSVVPSLRADYVRRMRGGNDGMTVRFAMADSVAIALPLAHGDTDWAEIKGGVTMSRSNLSFGAGFETAVAREGAKDDRAMVEVGLRF